VGQTKGAAVVVPAGAVVVVGAAVEPEAFDRTIRQLNCNVERERK
jgi:hypothetical protein